ncbi:hypothetical protein IGI04_031675, partial [Brassica rapa subsp. trilocularis]
MLRRESQNAPSKREKAIIAGSFLVVPCIGFVSGKGGYHSTVLAGLCLPRVGLPFRLKRCFGSIYAESKSCRGRLLFPVLPVSGMSPVERRLVRPATTYLWVKLVTSLLKNTYVFLPSLELYTCELSWQNHDLPFAFFCYWALTLF